MASKLASGRLVFADFINAFFRMTANFVWLEKKESGQ
jgi:hypothetical protein